MVIVRVIRSIILGLWVWSLFIVLVRNGVLFYMYIMVLRIGEIYVIYVVLGSG